MTEIIQVVVLGLLQGVAELFPISSLGHTVIIPAYLGWGNLNTSPAFLPIVVTLHVETALALVAFCCRDWAALLRAFFLTAVTGRLDADPQGKTIWMVIVGTIPVGLIGLFLQEPIQNVFFSSRWPVLPAAFLCLNGGILLFGERIRDRVQRTAVRRDRRILDRPNLDDAEENVYRALVLGEHRGYRRGADVFTGMPSDVRWFRARLLREEVMQVRYIDYDYWTELSSGTRRVADGAARVRRGIEVFGVGNGAYWYLADALRAGATFPEPILVGTDERSPLVVPEGHVHLAAMIAGHGHMVS